MTITRKERAGAVDAAAGGIGDWARSAIQPSATPLFCCTSATPLPPGSLTSGEEECDSLYPNHILAQRQNHDEVLLRRAQWAKDALIEGGRLRVLDRWTVQRRRGEMTSRSCRPKRIKAHSKSISRNECKIQVTRGLCRTNSSSPR